jgi:hypothetical protein
MTTITTIITTSTTMTTTTTTITTITTANSNTTTTTTTGPCKSQHYMPMAEAWCKEVKQSRKFLIEVSIIKLQAFIKHSKKQNNQTNETNHPFLD